MNCAELPVTLKFLTIKHLALHDVLKKTPQTSDLDLKPSEECNRSSYSSRFLGQWAKHCYGVDYNSANKHIASVLILTQTRTSLFQSVNLFLLFLTKETMSPPVSIVLKQTFYLNNRIIESLTLEKTTNITSIL